MSSLELDASAPIATAASTPPTIAGTPMPEPPAGMNVTSSFSSGAAKEPAKEEVAANATIVAREIVFNIIVILSIDVGGRAPFEN